MEIKLPYGLRDDKLLTIEDVESGLKCNCVCPTCKKRLIARKGEIKEHHFAHDKGDDCGQGVETAIHIISKEFIKDAKYFTTPPIYYPNTKVVIINESQVPIESVTLESKVGSIVPDIVITSVAGKQLLVEITVTHKVDYRKYQKIRSMKFSAVEVLAGHLMRRMYSEKKYFLTDKDYKTALIEESTHKKWINNPRAENLVERINKDLKENYCEEKEIKYLSFEYDYINYVDKCPLNKRQWKGGKNKGLSYANIHSDCYHCKFKVQIEHKTLKFKTGFNKEVPSRLFCAGYLELDYSDLIKKLRDIHQNFKSLTL